MSYKTVWDFCKDTTRLVGEEATLREIYDAMLTVEQDDIRVLDTSQTALRELATSWSQRPFFALIRLTELFGGAEIEHTDDYVLALIGSLGGRYEQEIRIHLLRHDHALRDDVFWRVFEVEGGGEISLANIDKFSRGDLNWHRTVVLLTHEGTLDRRRVLRSCLEALNRDFSSYRAGWFSRVYAALTPTPAEAAEDQELLLLSLSSSVTASVSLAVKQLAAVHKAEMLDAAGFVAACMPALAGSKAAALTVLRMLNSIAAQPDADSNAVAEAIAEGLTHPHADVQRVAVTSLLRLHQDDLIDQARELLAPAVLAELMPAAAAEPVTSAQPACQAPEAVPTPVPVAPCGNDDALELFASLLEGSSDAIEFERALAWLACTQSADEILRPLEKRARKINADDSHSWTAALVLAAVDPQADFLPQTFWQGVLRPTEEEHTILPSLVTRLREVAAIAQGHAPHRPLLATPTDSHGWIDADVLLERFRLASVTPLPADLAQALLRVPPPELDRVLAATGAPVPPVTESIGIEWRSRESDSRKANGDPQWVWWTPVVRADSATRPSTLDPGIIASRDPSTHPHYWGVTDLVSSQLALVHPPSTMPLTAAGIGILKSAADEGSEHRATAILTALANHPGSWTAETGQLVALGMSAVDASLKAQAAELFAAVIPTRLSAADAAEGFAACVPACILTRWADSFSDAAMLAPASVVDVLTALLPRLDRQTRGMGAILAVLLDESIRLGRSTHVPELRNWLAGFTGGSAAAKAAKALQQR
ncbi:DUF6493 family protein [Aeromicrobium sp. P5_D10]